MASYVYDIENVVNFFSIRFIDVNVNENLVDGYIQADIKKDIYLKAKLISKMNVVTFIITDNINEINKLITFLRDKNTNVLIGYNNFSYDDVILDYILQNSAVLNTYKPTMLNNRLYELGRDIIAYQNIGSYRKDYNIAKSRVYTSIDLMKLHGLDKLRVSLKQVSIALKWYRVEDYTPPPITDAERMKYGYIGDVAWYDRYVLPEHIPLMLEYNLNDVLITLKLYYHGINELKNRVVTQQKYGVDVLSLSRSGVADRLMSKGYSDATGLEWWDFSSKRTYRRIIRFDEIIIPEIQFKTKELKLFFNTLKDKVIKVGHDTFKETLVFRGTGYTFAKGGLHSIDRGADYDIRQMKGNKLIDWDYDSYYPGFVIEYRVKPKHLQDVIIDVIRHHRDTRVKAKKAGDKTTADIGKIVLNSGVFGKLGFEYSFMYDLLAMYKVTINLQLILLTLIEELELNNIHVISANTDGIVSIVKDEDYEKYRNICLNNARKFKFSGEFTEYKRYIRTSVNSYIAIKTDGKVKLKSEFVTDIQINKGYNAPVVAKTLYEYYVNDRTNIDEVIREYDIYDYCISIKVGSQFQTELHSIKDGVKLIENLQKDNRYFVSNSGGVILKYNKNENKYVNVIKKHYVTIFNTYYESNNYNINYNYYKARVMDVINRINNTITTKAKKQSGSLFDVIE
jgi:hypothetical protein